MKWFETLQELLKSDKEKLSDQTLLEKQCQQTCLRWGCHNPSISDEHSICIGQKSKVQLKEKSMPYDIVFQQICGIYSF